MESSHEYFDLLCAMVGANQASEEEERLLTEHAEACRECRQAVEQYRQIAWRIYEEEVGTETRQEAAKAAGLSLPCVAPWSYVSAESSPPRSPMSGAPPVDGPPRTSSEGAMSLPR